MREDRESRWKLQAAAISRYEAGPVAATCEPTPTALCLRGGRYRATLTDLGLDLVVRDMQIGTERRYTKSPGGPDAFADLSAFRQACIGEAP